MNKIAVITGGSRGIGAAISSLFAKSGYHVIINYNKSEAAALTLADDLTKKGYSAIAFKADISKPEECESLINFAITQFGKIDVLINNAGIAQQKLFTDIDTSDWNTMIGVNLSGTFYCSKAAVHNMLKYKSGNIINISSMWGISGASCEAHYSAAKSGLIGLTKALAKELGPSNIRVNCIAPGLIETDMNNNLDSNDINAIIEETPLSKIGKPEDVANTALFLASDSANFITGQVLSVDGGFIL